MIATFMRTMKCSRRGKGHVAGEGEIATSVVDKRFDFRARPNFRAAHETRSELAEARRILPAGRTIAA